MRHLPEVVDVYPVLVYPEAEGEHDLEEEEEEPEEAPAPPSNTKNVSMKAVPAAVLGGLASSGDNK